MRGSFMSQRQHFSIDGIQVHRGLGGVSQLGFLTTLKLINLVVIHSD